MTRKDRLKRDIDALLYKTGYDNQGEHTLWEVALKVGLSPNQVWLNNKKIIKQIQEKVAQSDIPSAAQEFGISTSVIERIMTDASTR